MKKIVIIFFVLCFSVIIYAEMPYTLPDLSNIPGNIFAMNENFKHLDWNKQDRVFKLYTTTPTINTLDKKTFGLYQNGNYYRIYVNFDGTLKYIEWTDSSQESGCKAYLNSNQNNVSSGAWIKVQLANESYDIGNNFDTTLYRFTAPTTGYYIITPMVTWTQLTSGKYMGGLYKNGSSIINSNMPYSSGGDYIACSMGVIEYLAKDDYLELYAKHEAGVTTPDIYGESGGKHTFLSVKLITVNNIGASGGGVTDHGSLTGLGDNDHPQYILWGSTVDAKVNTNTSDIVGLKVSTGVNQANISTLRADVEATSSTFVNKHDEIAVSTTGLNFTKYSSTGGVMTGLISGTSIQMSGQYVCPDGTLFNSTDAFNTGGGVGDGNNWYWVSPATSNLDMAGYKIIVDSITTNGEAIYISTNIYPTKSGRYSFGDIGKQMIPNSDYDIALWHLDNNDTTQEDVYNLHVASVISGTYNASGVYGGCYTFVDGSSNHMICDNASDLSNFRNLTVMAWINPDDISGLEFIAGQRSHSAQCLWSLCKNNATIGIYIGNGGAYASAYEKYSENIVSAGVWQHVAATWDGAIMKIYHNGIQRASQANTVVPGSNSTNITIGCIYNGATPGWFFDGKIDEVLISTKCYSASEIHMAYIGTNKYYEVIASGKVIIGDAEIKNITSIKSATDLVIQLDSDGNEGAYLYINDGLYDTVWKMSEAGAVSQYSTLNMQANDIVAAGNITFGTAQDTTVRRHSANMLGIGTLAAPDSLTVTSTTTLYGATQLGKSGDATYFNIYDVATPTQAYRVDIYNGALRVTHP